MADSTIINPGTDTGIDAPIILVNGPWGCYGHNGSEFAIRFAVKHRAQPEIFDPFHMERHSTMEEAQGVDTEFLRSGIKKAIVLTSDYHTQRERHIFHQQGGGETEYQLASAPNPYFEPDGWRFRVGKRVFLLQTVKTLNVWVE